MMASFGLSPRAPVKCETPGNTAVCLGWLGEMYKDIRNRNLRPRLRRPEELIGWYDCMRRKTVRELNRFAGLSFLFW